MTQDRTYFPWLGPDIHVKQLSGDLASNSGPVTGITAVVKDIAVSGDFSAVRWEQCDQVIAVRENLDSGYPHKQKISPHYSTLVGLPLWYGDISKYTTLARTSIVMRGLLKRIMAYKVHLLWSCPPHGVCQKEADKLGYDRKITTPYGSILIGKTRRSSYSCIGYVLLETVTHYSLIVLFGGKIRGNCINVHRITLEPQH